MIPFDTHLTVAQIERLALLSEECGEVQQVIGKILRHGYESRSPIGDSSLTNRELLETELGDLHVVGTILQDAHDLSEDNIWAAAEKKKNRINRFLHYNKV